MSLVFGCIWVFAATFVALLPMRAQYPPGLVLLIVAPLLLGWIAWDHGLWIAAAGMFAFVSMFRRPLAYFARRALGRSTEHAS